MDHTLKHKLHSAIVALLQTQNDVPLSKENRENIGSLLMETIDQTIEQHQSFDTREVNILLSDLREFTALSESFPVMQVVELLNRYLHKMTDIALSYGGTIDKFMGDSIMILFGAPEQDDDDLPRCLACAIEMQIAMDEINKENHKRGMPDIYMGIGINTGQVVAGSMGSRLHSEYTVIGDEVNLASRVEAQSLRGQILLGDNTYQKARDFIDIGRINEVLVKGRLNPVRMYELSAVLRPKKLQTPLREIRNSPRVQVNIPVNFRTISGNSVSIETFEGTVSDISYGGFVIKSVLPIDIHSEVKINLNLSLMGNQNRDMYAKVLRTNFKEGFYESHLEFTSIDDKSKLVLKHLVDDQVAMV